MNLIDWLIQKIWPIKFNKKTSLWSKICWDYASFLNRAFLPTNNAWYLLASNWKTAERWAITTSKRKALCIWCFVCAEAAKSARRKCTQSPKKSRLGIRQCPWLDSSSTPLTTMETWRDWGSHVRIAEWVCEWLVTTTAFTAENAAWLTKRQKMMRRLEKD